jgi:hypothetical protein
MKQRAQVVSGHLRMSARESAGREQAAPMHALPSFRHDSIALFALLSGRNVCPTAGPLLKLNQINLVCCCAFHDAKSEFTRLTSFGEGAGKEGPTRTK